MLLKPDFRDTHTQIPFYLPIPADQPLKYSADSNKEEQKF